MSTVITLPNGDTSDFVAPVPGVLGNPGSWLLDGTNKFVELGDNYDFTNAQAFSYSMWVKFNNLAAQRVLISKSTIDANVWGYVFYHNAAGRLFVQMRASGTLRSFTFGDVLSAGTWYHIVFTYAGGSNMSGLNAYINGALDSSSPATAASLNDFSGNGSTLKFGQRSNGFYLSGNINNFTVWDTELSGANVTELYNGGVPNNPTAHTAAANLQSWWRLNNTDDFPTETDQVGSIDGTMTNMSVGDYDLGDVP